MHYKKVIRLLGALSEYFPKNLECAHLIMLYLDKNPLGELSERTLHDMMYEPQKRNPAYTLETLKILMEQKVIIKFKRHKLFWYRLKRD
jgi:hypothetical protein